MSASTPEPIHPRAVEVLLFDLGRVVLDIDWKPVFDHWARAAGIDAQRLHRRFNQDEAYDAHERGELTAAQYFASLRKSLAIEISDPEFEPPGPPRRQ